MIRGLQCRNSAHVHTSMLFFLKKQFIFPLFPDLRCPFTYTLLYSVTQLSRGIHARHFSFIHLALDFCPLFGFLIWNLITFLFAPPRLPI